jgi:hypothetical protein
LKTTI